MPEVKFISHLGKKILYEDYSNASPQEMPGLLQAAKELIASQPPASVLAAVNVTNARFDKNVSEAMKQFVKDNTPYIKCSTIFGLSPVQSIIYKGIVLFTGRKNLVVVESYAKAVDYLAELK